MNDAHFHILINHFPIVGVLAALILLVGILFKMELIKQIAYSLFILSALLTIPTNYSGEGAEEIVEEIQGVDHDMIEKHEEAAEFGLWANIILGLISVVGLFLSIKSSGLKEVMALVILCCSGFAIYFMWQTGLSGGKIRHSEIYTNSPLEPTQGENEQEEED